MKMRFIYILFISMIAVTLMQCSDNRIVNSENVVKEMQGNEGINDFQRELAKPTEFCVNNLFPPIGFTTDVGYLCPVHNQHETISKEAGAKLWSIYVNNRGNTLGSSGTHVDYYGENLSVGKPAYISLSRPAGANYVEIYHDFVYCHAYVIQRRIFDQSGYDTGWQTIATVNNCYRGGCYSPNYYYYKDTSANIYNNGGKTISYKIKAKIYSEYSQYSPIASVVIPYSPWIN